MSLPTKSFSQYQNDLVAAWAANIGLSPVLTSGDPLLAIMQSVSTQLLWLQFLVETVNNFARASTSTGIDLDTWLADFGFVRIQSSAATGVVTFGVLSQKTVPITIPLGTLVQTVGGVTQYQVIADTTQTAYSSAASAYVLPANTSSITATVKALTVGSINNVLANQLTQLGTSIPGLDTVTNANAITSGQDQETDAAVRSRFVLYISNLSKATKGSIAATILGYKLGLSYSLAENVNLAGSAQLGYFFAAVDDGSGATPSAITNGLQNSIDLVRAFTVQQNVFAASGLPANIVMNVRLASGAVTGTVQTIASSAVSGYINSLTVGQTLFLNKLVEIVIDSTSSILSVQPGTVTINGSAVDLVPTTAQIIKPGTVTIGTY